MIYCNQYAINPKSEPYICNSRNKINLKKNTNSLRRENVRVEKYTNNKSAMVNRRMRTKTKTQAISNYSD